jgi:hypothetical protein
MPVFGAFKKYVLEFKTNCGATAKMAEEKSVRSSKERTNSLQNISLPKVFINEFENSLLRGCKK